MASPVISVRGLGKRYELGLDHSHDTLRDHLAHGTKALLRRIRGGNGANGTAGKDSVQEAFWALRDVSFDIQQGEVVGVIGRNGAGKSTLLKILSQITEPTTGEIRVRGRVASLLEVGTGFHTELSGRENIYLNGAILGMKKAEIRRKFDEIVAFSELERFLDTPVKRYSSGMHMRLAFAVAAHLEPEILIVDEVLAVGDVSFQKKCLGKMEDVSKHGRTVLFVSHNSAVVQQLTQTCILLEKGSILSYGISRDVLAGYMRMLEQNKSQRIYDLRSAPRRFPELDRSVDFMEVSLEDNDFGIFEADAEIPILIKVNGRRNVENFRFSMTILLNDGTPVGNFFGPSIHSIKSGEIALFRLRVKGIPLARGKYFCALSVGIGENTTSRNVFDVIFNVLDFEVMAQKNPDGTLGEWLPIWGPIRFPMPLVERVG